MTEQPRPGKRTVSLPTDDYLVLQQIAEADGVSLAAWILDAARHKRARRAAEALATAMLSNDVSADVAGFREAMAPFRATSQQRLDRLNGEAA